MKVKITRGEREKGLIFKTTAFSVKIEIEYDDNEHALLKQGNLYGERLYGFDGGLVISEKRIESILCPSNLQNYDRTFDGRAEANKWEDTLRVEALPRLKALLEKGQKRPAGSEEFTL